MANIANIALTMAAALLLVIGLWFVVAVIYCIYKISKSDSHQPAGETSTTTPLYQVTPAAPALPMFLPDEPYISRED